MSEWEGICTNNNKGDCMSEVQKYYRIQYGIGRAKYVVSFHDGKKTHSDGSRFEDMRIFKNKPDLNKFLRKLDESGYVIREF